MSREGNDVDRNRQAAADGPSDVAIECVLHIQQHTS